MYHEVLDLIFLGFTEVSLGLYGFYLLTLGFIEIARVEQGFTWFYWLSTLFHSVLLSFIQFY